MSDGFFNVNTTDITQSFLFQGVGSQVNYIVRSTLDWFPYGVCFDSYNGGSFQVSSPIENLQAAGDIVVFNDASNVASVGALGEICTITHTHTPAGYHVTEDNIIVAYSNYVRVLTHGCVEQKVITLPEASAGRVDITSHGSLVALSYKDGAGIVVFDLSLTTPVLSIRLFPSNMVHHAGTGLSMNAQTLAMEISKQGAGHVIVIRLSDFSVVYDQSGTSPLLVTEAGNLWYPGLHNEPQIIAYDINTSLWTLQGPTPTPPTTAPPTTAPPTTATPTGIGARLHVPFMLVTFLIMK
jgi:hypothetical protein